MAKVNNPPAQNPPAWPWGGGPGYVRERLVDPRQVDRRKLNKKSNAKNPPLASMALLDFIGPAHGSDELRLPFPELPPGHGADLDGFLDRPHLMALSRRADEALERPLEAELQVVQATPERHERMRALAMRDEAMLELVQRHYAEVREIERRRREELQGEEI